MGPNPQETADVVTFTEEILNGKLHFLCSSILIFFFKKTYAPTFQLFQNLSFKEFRVILGN